MELWYTLPIALIALSLMVMGGFMMLLVTGVIHEMDGAEAAAIGYRDSWRGLK